MSRKGDQDNVRAQKTLYVTGFDSRYTSKRLLEELFIQGGPVVDITMFDSHAYVLFQHEESVPYCLALFNETELYGAKLRLNPRIKTKGAFSYLKHLQKVREKIRAAYSKIPPPDLPPREQVLYPKPRRLDKMGTKSVKAKDKVSAKKRYRELKKLNAKEPKKKKSKKKKSKIKTSK